MRFRNSERRLRNVSSFLEFLGVVSGTLCVCHHDVLEVLLAFQRLILVYLGNRICVFLCGACHMGLHKPSMDLS